MRPLILKVSMSVDGFVAGPAGETDWMAPSRSAEGRQWVLETLREAGLHLFGRKSFFQMSGYWSSATDPMAQPMNDTPKAVFTRQAALDLGTVPAAGGWAAATVVTGDLAAAVGRLKDQPGRPLLAQGGVGFLQSLVAANLVDEYRLVVHPVALGRGQPLFAGLAQPAHLTLTASQSFPAGTVVHTYRPAA